MGTAWRPCSRQQQRRGERGTAARIPARGRALPGPLRLLGCRPAGHRGRLRRPGTRRDHPHRRRAVCRRRPSERRSGRARRRDRRGGGRQHRIRDRSFRRPGAGPAPWQIRVPDQRAAGQGGKLLRPAWRQDHRGRAVHRRTAPGQRYRGRHHGNAPADAGFRHGHLRSASRHRRGSAEKNPALRDMPASRSAGETCRQPGVSIKAVSRRGGGRCRLAIPREA